MDTKAEQKWRTQMDTKAEETSSDRYTGDEYFLKHPDWHAADAPGKAKDLEQVLEQVIREWEVLHPSTGLALADIGAGVGLVLNEVCRAIKTKRPSLSVTMTAYEISPQAAKVAREKNPQMRVEQRLLREAEEQFDIAMLVDVLEHVENPWELLRTVRTNARYLVVRQPLLENFSRFRHDDYRNQRDHWGHISCFNYRSFLDMASACGWLPAALELRPPWELSGRDPRGASFLKRIVARKWPVAASFFIDGFYLIGAFKAA